MHEWRLREARIFVDVLRDYSMHWWRLRETQVIVDALTQEQICTGGGCVKRK